MQKQKTKMRESNERRWDVCSINYRSNKGRPRRRSALGPEKKNTHTQNLGASFHPLFIHAQIQITGDDDDEQLFEKTNKCPPSGAISFKTIVWLDWGRSGLIRASDLPNWSVEDGEDDYQKRLIMLPLSRGAVTDADSMSKKYVINFLNDGFLEVGLLSLVNISFCL